MEIASYRRWLDLKRKVSLEEVKKTLKLRTLLDKRRVHSPLKKVKDAILTKAVLLERDILDANAKAYQKKYGKGLQGQNKHNNK